MSADLAALRSLLAAAPGEWIVRVVHGRAWAEVHADAAGRTVATYLRPADAALIAAAKNALPGLLDRLERAEAVRTQLAALLEDLERAHESRFGQRGGQHVPCHSALVNIMPSAYGELTRTLREALGTLDAALARRADAGGGT